MIDVEKEKCFPLGKTHQHVNFPLSAATAWRWALRGLGPKDRRSQERFKLETVMIGGRRYTSSEAVARFIARLTEPVATTVPSPSKARSGQIDLAAARAKLVFGR